MHRFFYLEWDAQAEEEINNPDPDELVEFESKFTTPEWVAEDAAKDRYEDSGCDLASPDRWPRKFYLYDSEKRFLGLFEVDMEYSPDFYAHQMTE